MFGYSNPRSIDDSVIRAKVPRPVHMKQESGVVEEFRGKTEIHVSAIRSGETQFLGGFQALVE